MPPIAPQQPNPLTAASPVANVRILGSDDNLLRASWRNLYVMRWSGDCLVTDLNRAFGDMRTLLQERDRLAVVSLLDMGCKPPTPEGREVTAQQHKQIGDRLSIAYLVDGQGFWASIVLNTLIGIQTHRARRTNDERVFRDRTDACAWLTQFIPGGARAHEVDSVIKSCRATAISRASGSFRPRH